MDEAFVDIQNLSKIFTPGGTPALKEINARLPKGKLVGLVGPDGSGKTTLIRLIVGLLTPTSGKITISGFDTIRDPEKIHLLTGYMPQKFGLYEELTVMQNLSLYADLRGVMGEERKKSFEKLLQFTGLSPFMDRFAKALSGGMKQKLGLACALIQKPTLLLLDEPSVGVDPVSRRELWKMIFDLLKEGISVLLSTTYLDEAQKCDTVLLLNEGKLLYYGAPKALSERMEGRIFKVTDIQTDRRKLLFEILQQKNVSDGLIQGHDLRIALRKNQTISLTSGRLEPTPPRFEDAFIDILGGGPGGSSELADKMPPIKSELEIVISAEALTKKFGSFTAVDEVSLKVKRGEVFGLLGPNGAGKTTIFKMLCGLVKPTKGKALVGGVDLQKAPAIARGHIGYMAQKFSLYGNLSVLQNLAFFSGIYNAPRDAIHEMVETFKLGAYLSSPSGELPLGYKQRLALACANMHHPQVLFLDEPTSGVDPITRREFWNHINGLVGKGVTIMVTTHFMDEAEYCDRLALIYRGKIIHDGTPGSLKEFAKSTENPNPTLEDAFVKMIEGYEPA